VKENHAINLNRSFITNKHTKNKHASTGKKLIGNVPTTRLKFCLVAQWSVVEIAKLSLERKGT